LQDLVIHFIVSNLASKEDLADCQTAFKQLDTDNDGVISIEELKAGYVKIYGEYADDHVRKLFRKLDRDGSGYIDYSQWVVATINKNKLLTPEKLKAAFLLFDTDRGGSISALEVKEVLS